MLTKYIPNICVLYIYMRTKPGFNPSQPTNKRQLLS